MILTAPRGEFLLRGKGSAPAASRHNTIQLGSQALDKIANGPAFPDVFLKINHSKSILRFDIRFWNRPIQKRTRRPRADIQRQDQPEVLFSHDTPRMGRDRAKKGLQGAGALLSWPEAGTCGITFYPTVKLSVHPHQSQSGEYAAAHSANCAG